MRGSKLFVGNLSYSVTQDQLKELFSQYGTVNEVKVIGDKGFAFVEMSSQAEAENAKKTLDGYSLEGRNLKVNEARPKNENKDRNFKRY
jgi:RNA recognition motif-containing protein